MGFANLQGIGSEVREGSKRRANRWPSTLQRGAVDVAINPIRRKILVNSRIPLQSIPVVAGIEHSVVKNWSRARQVGGRCSTASAGKNIGCSLGHSGQRSTGRLVVGEDRGP